MMLLITTKTRGALGKKEAENYAAILFLQLVRARRDVILSLFPPARSEVVSCSE